MNELSSQTKILVRRATRSMRALLRWANKRQLALRTAEGKTVVTLPLSLAVVLGLLLALSRLGLFVIIAVIVLFILKFQLVVTRSDP